MALLLTHCPCVCARPAAGAAQSLGAGAILVNPWNITDMAQVRGRAGAGARVLARSCCWLLAPCTSWH